jgi:putative membrane protein
MSWHGGEWGLGAWLVMSLLMLIFWAVVIGAVVLLVRSLGGHHEPRDSDRSQGLQPPVDQARRILDERFARGELTEDEYTHRRDVLKPR